LEEVSEVRRICRYLPLLSLLCVPLASAQSSIDVNIGFGSAHDKATGFGIDNANSSNAFGSCSLSAGDPFCQSTPSLGNLFMGLGANIMLHKNYGVGFQAAFQPVRQDYGPLQYRETFYDFNGIYAPINEKRVMLELQGGLGGARTSFSINQSGCVGTAVCTSQTVPVGNANHFQLHAGVGVELFLTEHLFVRPQFDYHYVPGFTDQFNSTSVVEGMIWFGFNFGSRQ
jgi:hypothetical protein